MIATAYRRDGPAVDHASTKPACAVREARQPTILRAEASMTKAT
jgi:hypothetical protein